MRVEIKHSEHKKGFIAKANYVRTDYDFIFSEEEKAIIDEADLGRTTFLERQPPFDSPDFGEPEMAYKYEVRIEDLLEKGGFHHSFPVRRAAADFMGEVKEQLPLLKAIMDKYANLKLEDETLEL